jgi:DNA-binding transcriptional LysR family regulator
MASHSGLEIHQLRAFVTLVEHGRVTAAARALDRAQSTVSEALAGLERTIGAELAVRGRGGHAARLTAAGEALLPHARAILAAVDNAHAAAARTTRDARASVKIVANESTSTYVLPCIRSIIRRRSPA